MQIFQVALVVHMDQLVLEAAVPHHLLAAQAQPTADRRRTLAVHAQATDHHRPHMVAQMVALLVVRAAGSIRRVSFQVRALPRARQLLESQVLSERSVAP